MNDDMHNTMDNTGTPPPLNQNTQGCGGNYSGMYNGTSAGNGYSNFNKGPAITQQPPPSKRSPWFFGCLGILIAFVVFLWLLQTLGSICSSLISSLDEKSLNAGTAKEEVIQEGDGTSVIAVIDVKGTIQGNGQKYSSNAVNARQIIDEIEYVTQMGANALILDMDTPGGEVIASDEVYHALLRFKEKTGTPVVTCMHSMGASGGYYIAAASDYIVANRMTFTGSIGVIISSMNISGMLDKIGVAPETYCSGDMKDMLSMTRPRTAKEAEYVNKLVKSTFHEFALIVSKGRNQYYPTAEDVENSVFADGRVLSGAEAKELNLVDELGGFQEAVDAASRLANLNDEPSVIRVSGKPGVLEILLGAKSGVSSINARELLPVKSVQLEAGKLYFLAPSAAAL